MTPEQRLTAEVKLFCGQRGAICLHTNVGKVRIFNPDNPREARYFDTGLPVGWPDLMIIHPKGIVFYCETKIHPRKPTQAQLDTIKTLRSKNVIAGVAYNLNEFKTLWEEAELKRI